MHGGTMMAIRYHRQGGPEVLTYEAVPVPAPAPGEVLIRVHAAGINPPDWYARSGFAAIPPHLRPRLPLPSIPGSDLSGVVVAVTPEVTRWRVGDAVFGMVRFPSLSNGARSYAEYATAPEDHLAAKPAGVSHVAAAGVPMAGLTAYQQLYGGLGAGVTGAEPRDFTPLAPGADAPVGTALARRTVLVNGAAGGVGHFLTQLTRLEGATVVAVASGRHETFLGELGAHRFVDYSRQRPAEVVHGVDHLFDTVGGSEAYRLLPAVRDGGTISPVFHADFHPDEAAARGIRFRSGQVRSDGAQLARLAQLLDDGRLRVGIDATYPLAEAAAAHRHAERGHLQGKIVLTVAPG
ncbi:NADP-dependent oxidoreductase [Dactylosporangium matsuzakiense]|uniref:NADPH:quinone reductase n=1 Tax=Dactylosporangium matsuzakiense TaxID=53360 RepID=A0A9W6NK26_9ACTN|nr:NADP-dependent oxidoreductase [Dactylosporangium matsuzakiense]GLK99291.1 NADPH:quinone reductase [Dactylosporangium matsuzakiense]